MKFITITLLFALIAYSSLTIIPLEDRWCGSSVVSVAIVTKENGKESITKAKMTVPVNLVKAVSHLSVDAKTDQQNFNSGALIKKTQQGIIFTLDGPADSTQLGRFFEKDEDSENDIYIPYIFFTDAIGSMTPQTNPTNFSIDLYYKKDFKNKVYADNKHIVVTIRFLADNYNTNICQCMFTFFLAKIKYNWRLRNESLKYIRSQLFIHIRSLHANYKAAKTIKGNEADLKKVEILKIQKITQETECSNLKLTLDIEQLQVIEYSKQMDALVDPECEKYDEQINEVNVKLQFEMTNYDKDMKNTAESAAKTQLLFNSIDIHDVEAAVNENHKSIEQGFISLKDSKTALDEKALGKFTAKENEFNALKLNVGQMTAEAEIQYFEDTSGKIALINNFFAGSTWSS